MFRSRRNRPEEQGAFKADAHMVLGQRYMIRTVQTVVLALFAVPCIPASQISVERVLVLKKDHQLLLLSGEKVIKSYAVAIGRGGLSPKQQQGDHRTPEGLYQIDRRKADSRFHRALHISYPNEADRERARKLGLNPGGDIMIHGITNGLGWLRSAHRIIDWTDGCIAVTDTEIDEIWSLVPNGTPIEIRP